MEKNFLPKGYKIWKKLKSYDNYYGYYIIASKKDDVLFCIFDGISDNPIYIKKYKQIT